MPAPSYTKFTSTEQDRLIEAADELSATPQDQERVSGAIQHAVAQAYEEGRDEGHAEGLEEGKREGG